MDPITLRAMCADDAATVAALHAASWRTAYRHILSADYLAGPVDEERARHWQARLGDPDHSRFGVIAMEGDRAVGFVYVVADADPRWGHLIDNLHVLTDRRGLGIGPKLLAAVADGIEGRGWARQVYLWVYDANVRARAFYARQRGVEVETTTLPTVDGGVAKEWRVAWEDLDSLRAP